MMIWLIAAHVIICVLITIMDRTKKLTGKNPVLCIVWTVPVFGYAFFISDVYMRRYVPDSKRGYRNYEIISEEGDIVEEDEDRDEDIIVPMEEAIVEEGEEIRRRLMFHLLDGGASDNIRLLQKIISSDDIELAHFASTRVMSFRRNHEHDISALWTKISEDKTDRISLERYCALLKEYTDSGILPPALEKHYRNMLKEGYELLIAADPKDMDHREAYLSFLMESGSADSETEEAVQETLRLFPSEMRAYQLAAEFFFLKHDREGMDDIMRRVRENGIYLNQAGRRWYGFWEGAKG